MEPSVTRLRISPPNPNDSFGRAYGSRRISLPRVPIAAYDSKGGKRILRPVLPDAGLAVEYRQKLRAWMECMHESVMYWVRAAYNQNEPVLAQDAIPAKKIQKSVRRLTRRWQKNFDEASPELAKWFAKKASKRSDKRLQEILKQGGFSVSFKMTKGQRDILHATVNANVSLIKSIPQKYLTAVEGVVMRSIQQGRDLNTLTQDLQKIYKSSFKRAALIARDQNNKATSALTRVRRTELGLNEAIWMHSHAGKKWRPTHVKMNGKIFDIRKGMYDKAVGRWIQPGEEINCRCTSRPVVPGFS